MRPPFAQSTEIEFALSARRRDARISPDRIHGLLTRAVKELVSWLPDARSTETGIYLENGGRLYLDTGGHGEYAAPECTSPEQVAVYDKAGEMLLTLARAEVLRQHPDMTLTIAKNNVTPGYTGDATWGNHESHTCHVPPQAAAAQLIPHLVSRLPYAGAGCLSSRPGGCGFEWSQRAAHIVNVISPETTSGRAIFCTRVRNSNDFSADGWWRAHLIVKDSQRLPLGIYLTFGVTGLLFHLLNQGLPLPGEQLTLADPVQALQQFSLDRELKTKVPLADGRHLTALEIQWTYLKACERLLPLADLPEWASRVIDLWRETLENLECDPQRLAERLDTCLKHALFERALSREGVDWRELHAALHVLGQLRKLPPAVVHGVLTETARELPMDELRLYEDAQSSPDVRRVGGDRLRLAARLLAIDLEYHTLGTGIFEALANGGRLDLTAASPADVVQALRTPPADTRAALRGRLVREHSGQAGWSCDWGFVARDSDPRSVATDNPFSPLPARGGITPPSHDRHRSLSEMLRRLLESQAW
jgi:hypothetical protein